MSVLIVEDDAAVAGVVADALESRGYRTTIAATGSAGLDAAATQSPDIVLLDLGLPDIDGVKVCRQLRRWFANPVIVLTADGAAERKVAALDEGADDYVTKPFSMPELLARLRVAERHRHLIAAVVDDAILRLGDVAIDTAAHRVTVASHAVECTRKEFALLSLLARNPGKVLTQGTLIGQVWGGARKGSSESLRVHIAQLRRKLGKGPSRPQLLTEPGVGYRLALPANERDLFP